ncbi:MAG: hypothetical protein ACT4P6_18485 [Gemmatimonadaceae bacterium]
MSLLLVERETNNSKGGIMWRSMVAVGLATTIMACATSQTAQGRSAAPAYASDVVTFDELSRTSQSASNLYQALERIRPSFIRPRTTGRVARGAASSIDVFVNGGYAGDGNVLLTLHPAHIASVRFERRSQAFVTHGAWLRGENVLYVTLLR